MNKYVYILIMSFCSISIKAPDFTISNNLKDDVTLSFMLDRGAPYALQNQKAVVGAGQQNSKVGVGNTYMGRTFPIRGFVATSKGMTAQYNFTVDQLNKNVIIKIYKDKSTTLVNTGPITTDKLFFDVEIRK